MAEWTTEQVIEYLKKKGLVHEAEELTSDSAGERREEQRKVFTTKVKERFEWQIQNREEYQKRCDHTRQDGKSSAVVGQWDSAKTSFICICQNCQYTWITKNGEQLPFGVKDPEEFMTQTLPDWFNNAPDYVLDEDVAILELARIKASIQQKKDELKDDK